jgi:hypothetical protein
MLGEITYENTRVRLLFSVHVSQGDTGNVNRIVVKPSPGAPEPVPRAAIPARRARYTRP